jgi:hypothetical protein
VSTLYWVVAAVSITGVLLNIHRRRICFVLWGFSSATWAVADFLHGLPQQAAVQVVYFVLSGYGLLRWRPPRPPAASGD